MLRFALHGQGQNSQVSTRCHGMPCRGSLRFLQLKAQQVWLSPARAERTTLHRQPEGFLPALNDRVSTLGVNR
jgi:hypothetical protein